MFPSLQAFKTSVNCRRHIETCRVETKERQDESDDDEDQPKEIETVFRPAMEQFGPHQMQKC